MSKSRRGNSNSHTCRDCVHFDSSASDEWVCRRNPPAPRDGWPEVFGDSDWCGMLTLEDDVQARLDEERTSAWLNRFQQATGRAI